MASCEYEYQQGIHSLRSSSRSIKHESKVFYVVNLVILIGKQFISRRKRNKKSILFTVYLDLIKDTLVVMEQNANVKDEKRVIQRKIWFIKMCYMRYIDQSIDSCIISYYFSFIFFVNL